MNTGPVVDIVTLYYLLDCHSHTTKTAARKVVIVSTQLSTSVPGGTYAIHNWLGARPFKINIIRYANLRDFISVLLAFSLEIRL